MKPLTLEETRLKEEMKERCLVKGQYVDENAKAKFDMLCHLEDFEIQYWELQQENKILKENAENNDKVVDKVNWENMLLKKENKQLKDNWNELKESIRKSLEAIDVIQKLTGNAIENYTPRILTYKQIKDKMQELEQGSDNQ